MTVRSPSSCWLVNIYARPGAEYILRVFAKTHIPKQVLKLYLKPCAIACIYIYTDIDIDMCIFTQSTSYIPTYPHTPVGSPTMSALANLHRPCVQSHSPYIGPMCGR